MIVFLCIFGDGRYFCVQLKNKQGEYYKWQNGREKA